MKNFTGHQEQDSVQLNAELKVIERDEARMLGLKRYFTGKPCTYGHIDERLTSSRYCITCSRERARKEKHKRAEYFKEYYKRQDYKDRKKILVKKPENREQMNKRAREHYHENKNRMRKIARDKYYNMTPEQIQSMKIQRKENRKNPHVKAINTMRCMLFRCLKLTGKRKNTTTESMLKYKKIDLVKHLESMFTKDMNWGNHGILWEIDHTMPISYCIKNGISEPSIINQLANLKPMLTVENREKSDKPPIGININGIKIYWGEND